jgi:(p)ppGpp synthase/HD superfamily hydrolase
MPSIDALADRLSTYLGKDQVNLVRRAYFYAEQAHDGQRRRSGEAYVTHPSRWRIFLPTCTWTIRA